ncbi:hypothetical protein JY97_00690 [Alkalispirochaeta odontotermitis]|nr:hypothetical protein JY97_00690 [Alkalispirochaeta odontotermitis]
MTVYRTTPAQVFSTFVDLTTTNTTDLIATLDNTAGLKSVHICNDSGGAVTITVDVYDGTNTYKLLNAESVGANDTFTLELDVQLDRGQSLRATAASGNALHVTTTYLQAVDRA